MKKIHITILSLAAGIAATLCGGIASARTVALAEEEEQENGAVMTKQVNYFGNDVDLSVEYWNGTYFLADYTRNIYIHDGTTARGEEDMHQNPDKFPVYSSKTGKFTDTMAVSALYNVAKAYDYYTEANVGFDWKGVNGKNDDTHGNISSRRGIEYPIHVFVHMNAGQFRYNAAYSHAIGKTFCIIFMGDGSEWNSAANMMHQGAALDVLAHEYQHGVTEFYSKGLAYTGESGALNEAFSDMIALIVEGKEKRLSPDDEKFWIIGEDAVSQYGQYIRNIYKPDYPFRETYAQRYVGMDDNGGVHINSTIVTHMQYVACKKLPGYFTYERLAQLWLTTLKSLPANANFDTFAKKFRAAAADLNFSAAAQNAIADAMKESGFNDFYRVTFQNEDGTVLGTSFVEKGGRATAPANPKREHDENYRYEFEEWDQDYKDVQSDLVVTAKYKQIQIHTVRFLDAAGEVFDEQVVDIGKTAKKPRNSPTKDPTEGKRYVFDKWDYDFGTVTENIEVKPIFKEINVFHVKFLDGDGSVLKEQDVDEGKSATAPDAIPVKEADREKRYTFREWDSAFQNVTGNLEIKPLFDEIHLYTIQFVDSEGNALTEEYILEEGESVEAPEAPRKANDVQYTYTFSGWDGEYENVTKSAVISPLYDKELRTYSVVYYINGKISDPDYVGYGAQLKEPPKGYTGWFTDAECTTAFSGDTVTGHLRLYAKKAGPGAGLYIGLGVGGGIIVIGAALTVVLVLRSKKHADKNPGQEG